ncbi:MAG: hypothetical protein JWM36_1671, partial [Hyphomicrobiales bacterium]|nr:hypothetical protein [Hyphomicrobiales bacterium]
RLTDLGLLYNGGFQWPVSNLPFDWTFEPVAGALVALRDGPQDAGPELAVTFLGNRVAFHHVSHVLVLPPGRYAFSGRQQAQALHTERGLIWRLTCLKDPTPLADTPPLMGDSPWQDFAIEVTVPETCPMQMLQLLLPARVVLEQEISGTALYSGLALRRVERGFPATDRR